MTMKKRVFTLSACVLLMQAAMGATPTDSIAAKPAKSRLSVGGYGEIALTRNMYSDNVYRYSRPSQYSNDPGHGRFDVPHAVIYLSYDFGRGWKMSSEIEFEHGGTGSTIEKEFTEAGEWEQETEKGGEVALEQLWIEKSFARWANVRIGHIIVPVGLTNARHEPLNYFTVYRPEGEATILPCTWHDTGISFWGRHGDFRYEVMMVAGLDAFMFDRDNWVQNGAGSAFEFKVANKYGFAARLDNYSVKGLRIGLSGYYGHSMHNTYPHDLEGEREDGTKKTYDGVKGAVAIGAIDFTLDRFNWIVRGNADYGYVGDAATISDIKRNLTATNSPYKELPVAKNALAVGLEAGYNVLSQLTKFKHNDRQKMYLFGRYEYYNSYLPDKTQAAYEFTGHHRMALGFNYQPMPQIVVKGEYSKRFFKKQYNDEPSISIGVAYQGFFL